MVMHSQSYPAIFLDRDGVIIENRPAYVRSWDDVEILPGSLEALAKAAKSGFKIVIVTNQSGIGRGLIAEEAAAAINQRLVESIRQAGGRVDGVYMCPHSPDDNCECRKPLPGLLLQAAKDLAIDLTASAMIGDAVSDVQAGKAAGVQNTFLVLTGRGADQARSSRLVDLQPVHVAKDLAEALFQMLK